MVFTKSVFLTRNCFYNDFELDVAIVSGAKFVDILASDLDFDCEE